MELNEPPSPLLDESSRPEQWRGKGNQLISPFFRSIAREMGSGPAADKAIEIKNNIKRLYWRTRMHQLFKLTPEQFDKAGGDSCLREAVEEYGGGTFVQPQVLQPLPAQVRRRPSNENSSDAEDADVEELQDEDEFEDAVGAGEVIKQVENTLSQELGQAKLAKVIVPSQVIYAPRGVVNRRASYSNTPIFKNTPHPLKQLAVRHPMHKANPSLSAVTVTGDSVELDWEQFKALGKALHIWVFCKFGKCNVGAEFIRHAAEKIGDVYKGTSKKVTFQKLTRKMHSANRKNSKVRAAAAAAAAAIHPTVVPCIKLIRCLSARARLQEYIRTKIQVQDVDLCDRARRKLETQPERYPYIEVVYTSTTPSYPEPFAASDVMIAAAAPEAQIAAAPPSFMGLAEQAAFHGIPMAAPMAASYNVAAAGPQAQIAAAPLQMAAAPPQIGLANQPQQQLMVAAGIPMAAPTGLQLPAMGAVTPLPQAYAPMSTFEQPLSNLAPGLWTNANSDDAATAAEGEPPADETAAVAEEEPPADETAAVAEGEPPAGETAAVAKGEPPEPPTEQPTEQPSDPTTKQPPAGKDGGAAKGRGVGAAKGKRGREQINEYEEERKAKIARNKSKLKELGLAKSPQPKAPKVYPVPQVRCNAAATELQHSNISRNQ
jgi:hypothetical protein